MKAILCTKYGSPDVLELKEVEKPAPRDNQVLVKIHAASANPLDWHGMRGAPFLVRLGGGFSKPKDPRLGADLAGTIEAVGKAVTRFQPGDEVFGLAGGTFAEYTCVAEDALVLKPANISFEQAAAVPVAAYTALQGLRNTGHIQSGQKVLVNGAAGGVGTFAVQIARSFGAEVTGVCSTSNLELVRSIGAAQVIDYTREDFTNNGRHYDLIYDAVANRSISELQRALNPGGICVVAGFSNLFNLVKLMLFGPWASRRENKKVGMMDMASSNQKDLIFIRGLLETGKVIPVIDRCYPLNETPEAIRYLEKGHAHGKVIITIEQNSK